MRLKLFELVQQVEYLDLENMKKVLENQDKKAIRDWLYILHDKDVDEDGNLKKPHYHLYCRLTNSYDTKYIAEWFKVPEQYINTIKGKWVNALSYAIHDTETAKSEGKYQYGENEVVSNFDWKQEIIESKEPKKKKKRNSDEQEFEEVLELINSGEIKEHQIFDRISIKIYSKYKARINNALEYYKERIYMNKDRKINVIFCTGATGTGKTKFAKSYAKKVGKSVSISSSSNDAMQDYKGEDILVLDDLRDDSFSFTDLLKILDNHTKSTMKSRYYNKGFIGDTIIITSFVDINKWYLQMSGEDRTQLFRRIPVRYVFDKENVKCYSWNNKESKYIYDGSIKNLWNVEEEDTRQKSLDIMKAFGADNIERAEAPKQMDYF